MYYYECPLCGLSLDPGERCDCREKHETSRKVMDRLLTEEKNGQMVLKEAVDYGTHTWI